MTSFSQLLSRISFRHNLIFILGLIVAILLLIYVGGQGIGGTFIYPLCVLFNQLNSIGRPSFWILMFCCLLFFILARNIYNRLWTLVSVGLMMISCWSSIFYLKPFFDTGWRELDSTSTSNHRYYLAIYETISEDYYYVYKCNDSGVFCTQLAEVVDWRYPGSILVHLQINNNRLQVVVDDGEILYEHLLNTAG